MTLNNIIFRIQSFAESHKQIKHFDYNDNVDWLHLGEIQYPACFVELLPGTISIEGRLTTYNFRAWFCDLEDTASKSQNNQVELESDLTSIAEDFISMLWQEAKTNSYFVLPQQTFQTQYFNEKLEDQTTAVSLAFSIASKYNANRCQVPATGVQFESTNKMFIDSYKCEVDAEGSSLTFPSLKNKKILIVSLGDKLLKPVNSNPTPNDYVYNVATGEFTFGTDLQVGQFLQILNTNL